MGLLTAQLERAKQPEAIQARYKALLVDSPTLVLPGDNHFAFSFNPSAVVSPGEGRMVYPTFHASADWGALDVADGCWCPPTSARRRWPRPRPPLARASMGRAGPGSGAGLAGGAGGQGGE